MKRLLLNWNKGLVMSKLEELIQQYCPDGVEYKPIGEVCKTKTPPAKLKTSDYKEQGLYHIIDQGQGQYAGFTDDEYYLLPDAEYVLYGDHTCIVKYHNGCFAQGADGLKILVPIGQNVKYVYYALSAYNLTNTEYKRHWTQAKEIEIPIPPLPVQEEIVRILDTFTELQAELQAELQKRLQQYNYYRDKLLSFKDINREEQVDNIEWRRLGDLGIFYGGLSGKTKDDFVDGNAKFITYKNIYSNIALDIHTNDKVKITEGEKQNTVQFGDVLFTGSSETPD